MRIFKTIDEKLNDIGFIKVDEDKYGATYVRNDVKYPYTQRVDIVYKKSGRHILHSYDPALSDQKGIGNICVGLTYTEMKLFCKKMAQMKMKS